MGGCFGIFIADDGNRGMAFFFKPLKQLGVFAPNEIVGLKRGTYDGNIHDQWVTTKRKVEVFTLMKYTPFS